MSTNLSWPISLSTFVSIDSNVLCVQCNAFPIICILHYYIHYTCLCIRIIIFTIRLTVIQATFLILLPTPVIALSSLCWSYEELDLSLVKIKQLLWHEVHFQISENVKVYFMSSFYQPAKSLQKNLNQSLEISEKLICLKLPVNGTDTSIKTGARWNWPHFTNKRDAWVLDGLNLTRLTSIQSKCASKDKSVRTIIASLSNCLHITSASIRHITALSSAYSKVPGFSKLILFVTKNFYTENSPLRNPISIWSDGIRG